jgi:transcriptional regulator with GAF, ATPase, and Fis domain
LYESEFFGHVKGAFSGAVRDRAGRFEAADGGTLFLDEVGEIPLDLQGKLLRVLQEGTFERVGEASTQQADVRIIAATNRDLQEEVDAGRFRQDLYYRLNVFPIAVAPLRERKEDIAELAGRFLEDTCRRMHRREPRLTQGTVEALCQYDWPGNVRELQNLIERAIITSKGSLLHVELPDSVGHGEAPRPVESSKDHILTDAEIRQLERESIVRALGMTKGKVSGPEGAAALLGIKPSTLSSRIKAMKIRWVVQ